MDLPFIDIHSHQSSDNTEIITLINRIVSLDKIDHQLCSVGIHPWYIDHDYDQQFKTLQHEITYANVLAIGECGMDKIHQTPWDIQEKVFSKQIQLANSIQKPLIIHCVRAYQETLQILKDQKVSVPVIFHGFNKKKPLADSIFNQGHYISLGTSILQGGQDELIQNIELTKFFFETDNKSTSIVDIYYYFCNVRKMPLEQLKEQIIQNLQNVFKYSISA